MKLIKFMREHSSKIIAVFLGVTGFAYGWIAADVPRQGHGPLVQVLLLCSFAGVIFVLVNALYENQLKEHRGLMEAMSDEIMKLSLIKTELESKIRQLKKSMEKAESVSSKLFERPIKYTVANEVSRDDAKAIEVELLSGRWFKPSIDQESYDQSPTTTTDSQTNND